MEFIDYYANDKFQSSIIHVYEKFGKLREDISER